MALSFATDTLLPTAAPAEAGFLPERLERIGPAMQRFVDAGKVPNLVTLVARHGRIVHLEARGVLDLESQREAGLDALFRLYSNSKPIAGLATMLLFEDGLLTPDDPISKYIPAFKNPQVRQADQPNLTEPARREVTIRDCLRHTSGIATLGRTPLQSRGEFRDELRLLGWSPADASPASTDDGGALTARERVEALARLPLSFQPGTAYEYHAGYLTLGAVLEVVAGKPLEQFYQERIFGPLGMRDSSFYVDDASLDRYTTCYRPTSRDGDWKLTVSDPAATSEKVKGPKTFFAAGGDRGGIVSTIGDYARFGQMLLNGGELDGVRLLGRKTVEYMTSDHSEGVLMPGRGPGYGWGMGVAVRSGVGKLPAMRSIGSYFWSGAAGTQFLADPKEDLMLLCFTQVLNHRAMPGNTYWEDFERLVYQALA